MTSGSHLSLFRNSPYPVSVTASYVFTCRRRIFSLSLPSHRLFNPFLIYSPPEACNFHAESYIISLQPFIDDEKIITKWFITAIPTPSNHLSHGPGWASLQLVRSIDTVDYMYWKHSLKMLWNSNVGANLLDSFYQKWGLMKLMENLHVSIYFDCCCHARAQATFYFYSLAMILEDLRRLPSRLLDGKSWT